MRFPKKKSVVPSSVWKEVQISVGYVVRSRLMGGLLVNRGSNSPSNKQCTHDLRRDGVIV